jgi:N-carbamoylputrescine amidase
VGPRSLIAGPTYPRAGKEKTVLTVALLQLSAHGEDQEVNLRQGAEACRVAKVIGADIALFPEMWNVGYTPTIRGPHVDLYQEPRRWGQDRPAQPPEPAAVWRGRAINDDAPFVQHFRRLAGELEMAIALTYLRETTGRLPQNCLSLIDRHGEIVLTYAKVHTCAFNLAEYSITPGDAFDVGVLDTASGEIKVGAMICYDREFPESARSLMLAGAELILCPNACEVDINRLAQLRARAMENMVAVAMTNYPGQGWGHSAAFDGIAFAAGKSRDMLAVEAGERAGIYPATFDIEALRAYRRRETWGDAFRRPSTYRALVDAPVREPFTRVNHLGQPPAR